MNERKNPLTVISKTTFGEYNVHDIQQNSSWGKNPYEDYAVVPDELVESILETRGFVEITLNEDETEIVSFKALDIPEISEPEAMPTLEDRMVNLEAENESLKAANEELALANEELAMTMDVLLTELIPSLMGEE